MKGNRVLTTGDVASICRCSHDTVKRWLEREELRGHRLPPQGQWRVLPEDLLDFVERHGLPIDNEERVLLSLPTSPATDTGYMFCWEFHRRDKTHPAAEDRKCEDCLVFRTKTRDCFVLRDHMGHQEVFCRGPCEECAYYLYAKNAGGLPDNG